MESFVNKIQEEIATFDKQYLRKIQVFQACSYFDECDRRLNTKIFLFRVICSGAVLNAATTNR